MFVPIGCMVFVVAVILLSVGAMIRQPATAHSKGTGGALITGGVVLLFVSATILAIGWIAES